MPDMNLHVRRFSARPWDRRRVIAFALVLAALTGVILAAMTVRASASAVESSIAPADRLLEHGIELKPLPATALRAIVPAESARDMARLLIDAPKDPEETYRVLASATYFSPKRTSWLFLFAGGSGPISAGPVEGADSRAFTTDFTGVLVDDQTGEVLRWFQGWHFEP
jgi:hypothetical protein